MGRPSQGLGRRLADHCTYSVSPVQAEAGLYSSRLSQSTGPSLSLGGLHGRPPRRVLPSGSSRPPRPSPTLRGCFWYRPGSLPAPLSPAVESGFQSQPPLCQPVNSEGPEISRKGSPVQSQTQQAVPEGGSHCPLPGAQHSALGCPGYPAEFLKTGDRAERGPGGHSVQPFPLTGLRPLGPASPPWAAREGAYPEPSTPRCWVFSSLQMGKPRPGTGNDMREVSQLYWLPG
ncbi:uncharacterized protein ACOB8E_001139 isoform 1-T1 [Sarcophilus harrisii]